MAKKELRYVVYPYKMGSASGKLLARALEAKRVCPDREYSPKTVDVIVNWGSGYCPDWGSLVKDVLLINHWRNVCYAIDKWESFSRFTAFGVSIPKVTRTRGVALEWLEDKNIVIGRAKIEGTRGDGILVMQKMSDFQNCALYTQYVAPTKEFRVYVFNGKAIDVLEKRRDSDRLAAGDINYHVRSEENGWVFCRQNVQCPPQVAPQAVLAVQALGLVFGGVDVLWNKDTGKATVLEVNTAPGIFGPTVDLLANEITQFAQANAA